MASKDKSFINRLIAGVKSFLSSPTPEQKKETPVKRTKKQETFFEKVKEKINDIKKSLIGQEEEEPKEEPRKKRKTKKETEEERARKDSGLTKKEWDKQNKKIKERGIIGGGGGEDEHDYETTPRGNIYYKNFKDAKKYYRHLNKIKDQPTLKQADAWLKRIGAGAEYFIISTQKSPKGQTLYCIFDIRSPAEKKRRQNAKAGKNDGTTRAQQIKKGGK